MWDVLCNLETGKISVHKDIVLAAPTISSFPSPPALNPRSGVVAAIGEEEGLAGKIPLQPLMVGGGPVGMGVSMGTTKSVNSNKNDNFDVQFMEDVSTSLQISRV